MVQVEWWPRKVGALRELVVMAANPIIDPGFGQRIRRVERKQERIRARGSRRHVGPDGLVVEYPRRFAPKFPLRPLLLLLLAAFGFKLWMFMSLGVNEYTARVDRMAQGNMAQQVAAWLLQPDPVTERAASWVNGAVAALQGGPPA